MDRSVPRVDALEKVTGKAAYCDDIKLLQMLHVKLKRSPYPHAKIVNIDTSKAEQLFGVRCLVTGKDVPEMRLGGSFIFDQHILPKNVARYVGEPVVAVAADSVDIADEALGLIHVEYDELPAIFDAEKAMSADPSVIVHPDLFKYETRGAYGGPRFDFDRPNIMSQHKIRKGDVDKGFHQADLVIEDRFTTARVQHCALEPQVAIAQPTMDGGLILWVGRQDIWTMRDNIGRIFNINPSKIRVIQHYVGGGFGLKMRIIVEPIVALLALRTGRPVKLLFTREEVFTHGGNDFPMIIDIKDGVKKDGTLVAREMHTILKGGAYEWGVGLMARSCSFAAVGTYRVPNFKWDSYGVYTNELPNCMLRGVGRGQVVFAIESHMDMLAERLGIDPLELRRRNILYEGEPNVTGEITHSIGARECLEAIAGFMQMNTKLPNQGPWKRGNGIALCNQHSTAPAISSAKVKISDNGNIVVFHGADEIGQGCNTVAAQIAAEEFGIAIDDVHVIFSDTFLTPPFSGGSTSSRVTYNLGNAVILACRAAKRSLFQLATEKLGGLPSELETRGGEVYVRSMPDKKISIPHLLSGYEGDHPNSHEIPPRKREIVGEDAWVQEYTPEDPETGQIDQVAASQGKRLSAFYSHLAKAIEVAVNVETGQVRVLNCCSAIDSCPINPKMCEQQMDGGMGMAIGFTLYEETKTNKGVVLNANFTDYRIPTANVMPPIQGVSTVIVPTPHKDGPFGAKGIGEGAMMGLPPAITSAIKNAVGVRIKDLPITPEKLLKAIKEKGG